MAAAITATTAAIFFTGTLRASGGHSASSHRQAANTLAATRTLCRPDTDRMWASPEICMARQVAWSMPALTPATKAAAMAPAGPRIFLGDAPRYGRAQRRDRE